MDEAIQWLRTFLNPALDLCRGNRYTKCRLLKMEIALSMQNKTSRSLQIGRKPNRSKKQIRFFFIRSPLTMCTYAEPQRGCTSCAPLEIPRHVGRVSNYQPLSSNQGIARINLHKNVNQCCSREYQEQAASHIRHCSFRHIIAENRTTSHCNPCSSRMPQYRT